ncbi:MAG TPA: radical SAM protein [Candidatus Bathyarchaeia archaeon]|nr:radical SAM protein [Candidatus Bathyarchaeia archaeon]
MILKTSKSRRHNPLKLAAAATLDDAETLADDYSHIPALNDAIAGYVKDAMRITQAEPMKSLFFLRTILWQRKAARVRQKWQNSGLHVPALLIVSVTSKCNLRCKGCYAFAHDKGKSKGLELSDARLRTLVAEARELGISAILFAGGEPLIRKDLLTITKDFPSVIFPIVTNGTLIDERTLDHFRNQRNVIPVISIEGDERDTDERRGVGMHELVQKAMEEMRAKGIFFGCSLTITRSNFATITDDRFIESLIHTGTKLILLLEYVSVEAGTEDWILTDEQRSTLVVKTERFRTQFPAIFIEIPGDEEQYGGCLAAGRGFVHVSPDGNLEPCPVSPYSDTSVLQLSLKEALQSRFLKAIRQRHETLSEAEGGCALWTEREWVQSLLQPAERSAIPLPQIDSKRYAEE